MAEQKRIIVDKPWKVIFIISQLSADPGESLDPSEVSSVNALVDLCKSDVLIADDRYTASIFFVAGRNTIITYKIAHSDETIDMVSTRQHTIEQILTNFISNEMRDTKYRYAFYVCGHSWMIYMILDGARTCCRASQKCSSEESENVVSTSFYAKLFNKFDIKTDIFLADSCSLASYESASTIAPYTKYYMAHMLCAYDDGYVSTETLKLFCENMPTEHMVKSIHKDYLVRNFNSYSDYSLKTLQSEAAPSNVSTIVEATIVICEPFKQVIALLNGLYKKNNKVYYRYKGFERNLIFPKYRVLDLYSYITNHPNFDDSIKIHFQHWFNKSIIYNQYITNPANDAREFSGTIQEGCYEPGSPEDLENPEPEMPEDPADGYPVKHGLAFFIEEPCWIYDQIIECVSNFVKVSEWVPPAGPRILSRGGTRRGGTRR